MSTASSELIVGPRAAVCVIANEVLSGKTQDTNTHFLAKFLFRRGIDLVRVAVIPDEMDVIVSTVKQMSDLVGPTGYVFTTGGIGPTHDDITYEGATAFGRGLEYHQPTVDVVVSYMDKLGRTASEEMKRMALLPAGCKVLTTGSWIHTLTWEGELAGVLKTIQKAHPTVAIGSYVNLTGDKTGQRDETYNTRLTVDGRNAEEVETAAEEIITATNGFRFQPSTL